MKKRKAHDEKPGLPPNRPAGARGRGLQRKSAEESESAADATGGRRAPAQDAEPRQRQLIEPLPAAVDTCDGEARKVLLVDDNRDAAQLLGMFLEASGHDVELAYDGPEAVSGAQALRPDAVLLDIGLPGMDGYEVARRIRRDPDLEHVQLIAISGYCQSEDRERSRAAGFDHHLAKPPDHDELLSLLSKAGRARRR